MRSSNMKFLFLFVLSIAIWSRVEADMEVTVTKFETTVFDNPAIGSWDSNLENGLIQTTLTITKNCPGTAQLVCDVYDETGAPTKSTTQLNYPMKDISSYGFCPTIDSPEPDDDDCSIAEGTHSASDCDVSSAFENQKPGNYNCKCTVTQNNEALAEFNMDVTVKEK